MWKHTKIKSVGRFFTKTGAVKQKRKTIIVVAIIESLMLGKNEKEIIFLVSHTVIQEVAATIAEAKATPL